MSVNRGRQILASFLALTTPFFLVFVKVEKFVCVGEVGGGGEGGKWSEWH